MQKLGFGFALIAAASGALMAAGKVADGDSLALPSWLVGSWITSDSKLLAKEEWAVPVRGIMRGSSETRRGNVVIEREQETIDLRKRPATLTVTPHGSPPVVFVESARTRWCITFENAQHDYPQRIRYQRNGLALDAEISRLDGSKEVRRHYRREEVVQ